jgi:sugar/nucleoside kinase (ribokinase family)
MCQNKSKILCVGQLVTDLVVWPVEKLDYAVADTALVERIELLSGGDAMNVSLNLSRLGADVCFAGMLGNDEFGKFLKAKFIEDDINIDALHTHPDLPTDTAVVMVNRQGNRSFLYRQGANFALESRHIPESLLKECSIVYVGGTFLLPGLDGAGTKDLFDRARRHGAITAMDVTYDINGLWMSVIEISLMGLDYFMPSLAEAQNLTGKKNPEDIADVLLDVGVKTAVIKLGAEGCYVKNEDDSFYRPAFSVKALDTTGAGDAFVSGFLLGISKGLALRQCADIACASGAITVQELGANTKELCLKNIEHLI